MKAGTISIAENSDYSSFNGGCQMKEKLEQILKARICYS